MREIKKDPKPGMPFKMIEGMMPAYPIMALMAWMIVLVAFLFGLFAFSPAQATFFSDAKAVREAAEVGSAFVDANVSRHVLETWLPQFKFVGLGLGLMAITMALGIIAKKLRHMGKVIVAHMPANLAPPTPPIPKQVRMFQLSTMMGIMVLLAALVIGIVLATGVVPDYWSNSIAAQLNPAAAGSELLKQLGTVSSFAKWLNPLRIFGMAFLFTGITVALTVIIGTLRMQANMLVQFYQKASG